MEPNPPIPATPVDLYLDLLKRTLTAAVYDESAWYVLGSFEGKQQRGNSRNPIVRAARRLLLGALGKRSMAIVKRLPYDAKARELGHDWPSFGYTMVGLRRLDHLRQCIEDVVRAGVPGDLIETGVWRGGGVIFMRGVLKAHGAADRTVWAADTFAGMPKPRADLYPADARADLSDQSYLAVSQEQVRANFARFGLLDERVRFLEGRFCDTLPTAPIERLAVLRLDGDLYESTMDALNALYHKVSPGGYVIVDDYEGWPMCRQAVGDFRARHGIDEPIQPVDGQAVYWQVRRPGAQPPGAGERDRVNEPRGSMPLV